MSDRRGLEIWQDTQIHTLNESILVLHRIVAELQPLDYADRERFGIRLALEEALVNAIKHGHRGDESKTVHIRYRADAQQFLIEIRDEGRGFDPEALPDPLAPENLERPGGRGVFLMRHYMSWIQYNEPGNIVTLCKVRAST